MKKQRSRVPVPGDAQVRALAAHLVHDELPVRLQERVGLVVGELAVGRPVGLDLLEREGVEQRPHHRPGHAVPAVHHHLELPDLGWIDVLERRGPEGLAHVLGVELARVVDRGSGLARGHEIAELPDARVAGERQGAAAHELGAGVGLGIVRGRAHQAAVQAARSHRPIDHLGARHPHVQHVHALVGQALGVARGHGRGREAHVAPDRHAQIVHGLVLQLAEHPGEGPPHSVGHLLVHLVRVGAADVVRLEDRGVDHDPWFYQSVRASRAVGRR